jgi:hypothetical protein
MRAAAPSRSPTVLPILLISFFLLSLFVYRYAWGPNFLPLFRASLTEFTSSLLHLPLWYSIYHSFLNFCYLSFHIYLICARDVICLSSIQVLFCFSFFSSWCSIAATITTLIFIITTAAAFFFVCVCARARVSFAFPVLSPSSLLFIALPVPVPTVISSHPLPILEIKPAETTTAPSFFFFAPSLPDTHTQT